MFTGKFWRATGERAAKSAAQALLLLWGGDVVFSAWDADWVTAGGVAAGAGPG
ncbi:holin, partial [Streptomyces griseus]|uniref:holin n=1 Tax=Streptomyces griseus TaxID=1911 RepID=UPI0018FE9227